MKINTTWSTAWGKQRHNEYRPLPSRKTIKISFWNDLRITDPEPFNIVFLHAPFGLVPPLTHETAPSSRTPSFLSRISITPNALSSITCWHQGGYTQLHQALKKQSSATQRNQFLKYPRTVNSGEQVKSPFFKILWSLLLSGRQSKLCHLPEMGKTPTCGQMWLVPVWLLRARTGYGADCSPEGNLGEMEHGQLAQPRIHRDIAGQLQLPETLWTPRKHSLHFPPHLHSSRREKISVPGKPDAKPQPPCDQEITRTIKNI